MVHYDLYTPMMCLIYKANRSQPIPNFHEFYPWAPPTVLLSYLGELFGFFGKLQVDPTHRLLEGGWLWLLLLQVRILLLKVRILLLLLKKARPKEDDGNCSKWGRDQNGKHLMRVLVWFDLKVTSQGGLRKINCAGNGELKIKFECCRKIII